VLLAPLTYFLATRQPGLTLVLFFVLSTWFNAGAGAVVVGWQDMIAKISPVDKRGRFAGVPFSPAFPWFMNSAGRRTA